MENLWHQNPAIILSSKSFEDWVYSNKLASLSTYALYRLVTNLSHFLKEPVRGTTLIKKAIFPAEKANKPVAKVYFFLL